MIAIYARRSDMHATAACTDLRKMGIPCILTGPEYGYTSVIQRVPFLFVGKGCEGITAGFSHEIPDTKFIQNYDMLTFDYLTDRLKQIYGLDYINLTCGGIRFHTDEFYFFGNRIRLTDIEKLIVRLLAVCRGCYFTAEEIAGFCLEGNKSSSVAVHIHNINAKNVASVTERIIYSKRYCGYRVK